MPKVTINFNLPEEQHAYELAVNAAKLRAGITEFDSYLRQQIKYGNLSPEQVNAYQDAREKLWANISE